MRSRRRLRNSRDAASSRCNAVPRGDRMRRLWLGVLFAVTLLPHAARAQLSQQASDMLRRIFASRDFAGGGFGGARWIEGGAASLALEPSALAPGSVDIVRYETATGARTVLVSARTLTPPNAREPLDIDDYDFARGDSVLLVFTNTRKVWRRNTRGDYWVLNTRRNTLKKLGGPDAAPSSLMYAKFSPTGDRVAYVRRGDLYVERLADGKITRLTIDGDSLHVNGMTDWVYEEEFDLRDGFRWSPDGTRIAFWHFDMSGVRTYTLINDTDSLYPYTTPIQYPKTGTPNSAVKAGIVSADGGQPTWIFLSDDLRDNYLPRMEWIDAKELVLQRMNRQQNTDRVLIADAVTGGTRTVLTERDSAWVDVVDDWQWLSGNSRFLWVSERDGWRHLYTVPRKGGTPTLITRGSFDVVSVAGIDEPAGWVYYEASPENATQRYLYRARLDGTGAAERITPSSARGTHDYDLSPGARWAVHRTSRFDAPPVTELVRLPAHQAVRTLSDNAALRAA